LIQLKLKKPKAKKKNNKKKKMQVKKLRFIFFLVAVFAFISLFSIKAQEEDGCQTLEECQALLEEYEKEISQYESNIALSQEEQKTLNNKIYLLKQKIGKYELQIKQSELIIGDLEVQVVDTENSIERTSQEIVGSKMDLAEILRSIHEEDQKTPLEILFSAGEISDFFDNLIALENLLVKNQEALNDIKALKGDLEEQTIILGDEKDDWERMKKIQILQKEESQRTKGEEEWLLYRTKGEEAEYQELLAESRAKAQKIRERLFELIGVPEAPTFGQALEIAKYVETVTGIRPAFLLAVLTQESNIGKNVGQCYLKNAETGSGIGANSGRAISRVMKPSRDVPPFLIICKELGRDPYNTLVSCPMSYGYGGAMGPAQFIPSTWVIYKDKLSAITGQPGDPWNIKDAFLAAGLLLKDAGGTKQTSLAEWRAAMVYFSGTTVRTRYNGYGFYGDSVINITKQYEQDIAQLEKYSD